jgi:hypothetical protein
MIDTTLIRQRFEAVAPFLDERGRRLVAASEAVAAGYGGIAAAAAATGISRGTIGRGIAEISPSKDRLSGRVRRPGGGRKPTIEKDDTAADGVGGNTRPIYRIRRPGGGRKLTEEKYPTTLTTLERMLEDEVAGDPMTEQKWIRSSLRRLREKLRDEGYHVSHETIARLLKKMNFSLKANKRKQGRSGCPDRDEQFKYIASQKQQFITAGFPIISIDTKKKELVGDFRNEGKTWRRQAEEVNEHDFPGAAKCRAVPFGIYDPVRNEGYVYVGLSNDTPQFAVHSIARWWEDEGRCNYPGANALLILADSGGSNGCRARAWKLSLQEKLCDASALRVTVCHYPTGCSKWNPVEHRLFSFISKNWEGKPLRTLEIMLGYIGGTRTVTGLSVKAFLDERFYARGRRVTSDDIDGLRLKEHTVCPKWNYTLHPRKAGVRDGGDCSQI